MSLESSTGFVRSVDSIQKIYAVVIALAISQAILSLLRDSSGTADLTVLRLISGLPAFVAFSVTVVPFWHGMNRYLDRCYVEKSTEVVQRALLFDLATFFIEAVFLFAAALSLRSRLTTFGFLALLLLADTLWAIISHRIHFRCEKSYAKKWSLINIAALAFAVPVIVIPSVTKPWFLMALAVLRTYADYRLCWQFYFPAVEPKVAKVAVV